MISRDRGDGDFNIGEDPFGRICGQGNERCKCESI